MSTFPAPGKKPSRVWRAQKAAGSSLGPLPLSEAAARPPLSCRRRPSRATCGTADRPTMISYAAGPNSAAGKPEGSLLGPHLDGQLARPRPAPAPIAGIRRANRPGSSAGSPAARAAPQCAPLPPPPPWLLLAQSPPASCCSQVVQMPCSWCWCGQETMLAMGRQSRRLCPASPASALVNGLTADRSQVRRVRKWQIASHALAWVGRSLSTLNEMNRVARGLGVRLASTGWGRRRRRQGATAAAAAGEAEGERATGTLAHRRQHRNTP